MTRSLSFLILVATLCSCVTTTVQTQVNEIVKTLPQGETLAVGLIYDDSSGNVTALGDLFRDRVEGYFRRQGVTVKARRDIGFIIDDLETFGSGVDEGKVWEQAGADILVLGRYSILKSAEGKQMARLTIKALRAADSSVVHSRETNEELPQDWARLSAKVKGNVYQEAVEILVDDSSTAGPALAARLDRDPACYPSATPGKIIIDTEPGSHVYLLNLAADHTVTLLYPNSMMNDQPLPVGHFEFPPRALQEDVQLVFYPLDENETIQESIKVLASKYPLDFSFLPVPENTIYAGAQGGEIARVTALLRENFGWSEKVVSYWVGPGCR